MEIDAGSVKRKYKPDYARHAFHRFLFSSAPDSTNNWKAFCPICEDPESSKSPSASFDFDKGVWHCQSGKCPAGGGSIYALVQDLKKNAGFDVRREAMLGRSKDEESIKPHDYAKGKRKNPKLTEENVTAWMRKLHNSDKLDEFMSARGLTVETLREYQVGWDGQRYTIPVRDEHGELVNVRRYKLNAGKADKMLNIPGHGQARIFGLQVLAANDTIVVTEGETDMMMANQNNIPACTHTAGAATFKAEWGPLFKDKIVYICYDNDEGGRSGAIKAAKMISPFAEQVYIIEIPIPVKGADVTDFFYKEGRTAEDFRELMLSAKPAKSNKYVSVSEAPQEGKSVSLEDSMAMENSKETMELVVQVSGKNNPPYYVPRRFAANCSMDKGAVCQACPLFLRDGEMVQDFAPNDEQLFRFIEQNEDKTRKLLKEISGARCSDRVEFSIEDRYTMEELVVGNSVDDRSTDETQNPLTRTIFSVGTHSTEVNSTVRLVAKNTINPRSGRAAMMAWKNEPVRTSLDTFVLDDDVRKSLHAFRVNDSNPDITPSPLDKCFEIAHDLSRNVTRIYGRDILHVAYDLVWHSPLAFKVDGTMVDKGWLEMMVVGDTRTGKSETALRLSQHYDAGIVKSCEGATFAGLVGGVQQVGSSGWMTTWGVIPLNDRRLVVLDEVSGLKDREVIENMSSIRSSGLAQITKIRNEQTSARTRLIWITNPADGSMIDDKPEVGMAALRTVVHNNEDIARFDYVMAVRASEVSSAIINDFHESKEPKYTKEMCSSLVLWAWSLQPDQIEFTARAVKRGRELAQQIGDEYVPDPPLMQTENVRFKIYRVAAALAARTFSIKWPKKDQYKLVVTEDHVNDAKRFLDMIYDSQGMQYRSASKKVIQGRKRAKERYYNCKTYLLEREDTVLHALRAIGGSTFRVRDFSEFASMTGQEAQEAVKKLLEWKMVHRKSRGDIVMDKVLVDILRDIDNEEEDVA